jgi:hypothetical protein
MLQFKAKYGVSDKAFEGDAKNCEGQDSLDQ